MISHKASKLQFVHHALLADIEEVMSRQFRASTGRGVSPSETQSWTHSLLGMAKVQGDEVIPDDAAAAAATEYQMPPTSKRIDFVISGEDAAARTSSSSSSSTHRRNPAAARRTGAVTGHSTIDLVYVCFCFETGYSAIGGGLLAMK